MSSNGAAVAAYARAILDVAGSEGERERLEDDLFRFARAVEASPELADRLSDPGIDLGTKLEVIDELLGARPAAASAVMWIVQSGRVRQLGQIADAVAQLGAESRGRAVAEVRAAVELDADQQRRLADALEASTGRPVEVRAVVDPSVVGGVVVRLGDEVIDGSVARHLTELRSRLTGV